jgi:hypothetical protein
MACAQDIPQYHKSMRRPQPLTRREFLLAGALVSGSLNAFAQSQQEGAATVRNRLSGTRKSDLKTDADLNSRGFERFLLRML